MKLGWRWGRANDFTSPDLRPLRDSFGELQRFMTWPHFTAVVDDGQAVTTTFASKAITALDDPYSLVRSTSRIQVPRDFDTWMFVGFVYVAIDAGGTGLYQAGWRRNGAVDNPLLDDDYAVPGAFHRVSHSVVYPLSKDDYLEVALRAPGATTVDATGGLTAGYFLPMT